MKTPDQIADAVMKEHAIQPEWVRTGDQVRGLLAEAAEAAVDDAKQAMMQTAGQIAEALIFTDTPNGKRASDDVAAALMGEGPAIRQLITTAAQRGLDAAWSEMQPENAPGLVPTIGADNAHEAAEILWSSDNGGYNGRPSEVKRILRALVEEIQP